MSEQQELDKLLILFNAVLSLDEEAHDIRRIFSVLGYIVNQSGEFNLIKI